MKIIPLDSLLGNLFLFLFDPVLGDFHEWKEDSEELFHLKKSSQFM